MLEICSDAGNSSAKLLWNRDNALVRVESCELKIKLENVALNRGGLAFLEMWGATQKGGVLTTLQIMTK